MGILYDVYAIVLLAGGVMGYVKAKSLPSLAAGIVGGLLMGAAAWLIHPFNFASPFPFAKLSLTVGLITSLIFAFFFQIRWLKTQKVMPALPIAVLSDFIFLASIFASARLHG